MIDNLSVIGQLTLEHISMVGVAVSLAILSGISLGIVITQNKRLDDRVLYIGAVIMTIPSIALFGLLIPVLAIIGHGLGSVPAVIALFLYAQLPIVRNTSSAERRVGTECVSTLKTRVATYQ